MSFLNPVNEPVLRFKSTDAGAPQINYNARVAGDVKAVLKACLVTGYGTKASAGWSIVNEINHVAEFVSPAAAMSDYRLGIDDGSTSSTTWYYQYQDSRTNPSYNTPTKNLTNVNKTHLSNGWQLLVTDRGLIFIEIVYYTAVAKSSTRLTYFSQVKSGLTSADSNNIMFFNIGHDAAMTAPQYLYAPAYPHFRLGSYTTAQVGSATPYHSTNGNYTLDVSNIDIASGLYLYSPNRDLIIGEVVGILAKVINTEADMYKIADITVGGRPALNVCAGFTTTTISFSYGLSRTYLIYLDYWEY